ncbi:MAG TPA: hypothetical protein PLM75_11360, partial [bacterium]|nr:hypothetical protein [bacterium]
MVTIYATYFYLNPISYNDTTTYSINKNFLTLSGLIGSPQTTNMLYLYNSETSNTTTIRTFTTTQDFSHTVY